MTSVMNMVVIDDNTLMTKLIWQGQWKTKHDMEKDKDKNMAMEKDLASWALEPLEHLVGQMTQSVVIWVWCGS